MWLLRCLSSSWSIRWDEIVLPFTGFPTELFVLGLSRAGLASEGWRGRRTAIRVRFCLGATGGDDSPSMFRRRYTLLPVGTVFAKVLSLVETGGVGWD